MAFGFKEMAFVCGAVGLFAFLSMFRRPLAYFARRALGRGLRG